MAVGPGPPGSSNIGAAGCPMLHCCHQGLCSRRGSRWCHKIGVPRNHLSYCSFLNIRKGNQPLGNSFFLKDMRPNLKKDLNACFHECSNSWLLECRQGCAVVGGFQIGFSRFQIVAFRNSCDDGSPGLAQNQVAIGGHQIPQAPPCRHFQSTF